jgi:hypothetical protein
MGAIVLARLARNWQLNELISESGEVAPEAGQRGLDDVGRACHIARESRGCKAREIGETDQMGPPVPAPRPCHYLGPCRDSVYSTVSVYRKPPERREYG